MFHELVLCGVGGRTVAEAKQNISYPEFIDWLQFRNKWGSFHIGMRVDRAVATVLRGYFNAHKKPGSPLSKFPDFSPYDEAAMKDERQGVDINDPEAVGALLKTIAKGGK